VHASQSDWKALVDYFAGGGRPVYARAGKLRSAGQQYGQWKKVPPGVFEIRSLLPKSEPEPSKEAVEKPTDLLREAVEQGDMEQVRTLMSECVDINAKDKNGDTVLHLAGRKKNRDIVEFLVSKGAKVNARGQYDVTALHNAIWTDIGIIDFLVSAGADANAKDSYGYTPLFWAVWKDKETIQLLIDAGADVDSKNKDGKTALEFAMNGGSNAEIVRLLSERSTAVPTIHVAAYIGDANQVQVLIEEGVDLDMRDKNGNSPLHYAAGRGCHDVVKLLIDNGADIHIRNKGGKTPLHMATQKTHRDVVQLLIAKEADINIKDKDGNTPLYYACRKDKNQDILELLLSAGAEADFRASDTERTLLHNAAEKGLKGIAKVLLDHDVNINVRDKLHYTPLHLASENGNTDVVVHLISNNADINAKNRFGRTPLDLAVANGHDEVIRSLIAGGANVNAQPERGVRPLIMASYRGYTKIAEILVNSAADVNATSNGESALHRAAYWGHKDVAELLIARGAEVCAKDQRGRTPLQLAEKRNHTDIVDLLKKRAAK